MAERAPQPLEIGDFPGLVTATDRSDLGAGAAEIQVNVTSDTPGELRVRPGYRLVLFDAGA